MRAQQGEAGFLCMIELRRIPAHRGMTLRAVIAARTTMHIIWRVAGSTTRRCIFVTIVHVTTDTGDGRVLVGERKLRAAMIKAGSEPGRCAVAGSAIIAKLSLMRLIRLVARHARSWRLTEFLAGWMTARAACGLVRVTQCKVGLCVIELFLDELDDVGIASLVFGVTARALQGS